MHGLCSPVTNPWCCGGVAHRHPERHGRSQWVFSHKGKQAYRPCAFSSQFVSVTVLFYASARRGSVRKTVITILDLEKEEISQWKKYF